MYHITITKDRPLNDEEKKLLEERDRRGRDTFGTSGSPYCNFHDPMPGTVREKALDVVLSDTEFAAVKKACLEAM